MDKRQKGQMHHNRVKCQADQIKRKNQDQSAKNLLDYAAKLCKQTTHSPTNFPHECLNSSQIYKKLERLK